MWSQTVRGNTLQAEGHCPSLCEFAELLIKPCLSSRHLRLWLIQRPDQKTLMRGDIIHRWERLNFSLIWEIGCDVTDTDPKDLISWLFHPSLNRCARYQICSLLLVPDFLQYGESLALKHNNDLERQLSGGFMKKENIEKPLNSLLKVMKHYKFCKHLYLPTFCYFYCRSLTHCFDTLQE